MLACFFRRVGGVRPFVPSERLAVKFHQKAEQAVVCEPVLLGGFEALEFVAKHLLGGGKLRPCELKQVALHAAHVGVIDACGLAGHADLVTGPAEIPGIEPGDF